MSMAEPCPFDMLHKDVQHWIWKQNWTGLRDIQERSIAPILRGDRDIIIGAATAAGKTEAAFLPACSKIIAHPLEGIGLLYISPLKTLINDQYRRLLDLCETAHLALTPWHGDVSSARKMRLRQSPKGILLITPESLESLLMNRTAWCSKAFAGLSHIIIDEFNAFIASERGCQLLSLLCRLDVLLKRSIPRIGLSATLGEMGSVAAYLRPNGELPVEIIESSTFPSDARILLKGYADSEERPALEQIISDLYGSLRGQTHIVFANSRSRSEEIAASLRDKSMDAGVENEFFPHHGSLSGEIRRDLELRLQGEREPTTAVSTVTLELGIDIGNVDTIVQISAPPTVAGLRQRLGRSGRRGKPAVLRMCVVESRIASGSQLPDRLRMDTFQCIAMVELLKRRAYEEPLPLQYHFSTLLQQTLSVIVQYNGAPASRLWTLLCNKGPFGLTDQRLYCKVLKAMGDRELISQSPEGLLILGPRGEVLTEHYNFYAAFISPKEYRLEFQGREIGKLPTSHPISVGQRIIFAGQKWKIRYIDEERRRILLDASLDGQPPQFQGTGQPVRDSVRQEMYRQYCAASVPPYLDEKAREHFLEGKRYFGEMELKNRPIVSRENTIYLFPWQGDRITNTISALLRQAGLCTGAYGGVIEIENADISQLDEALRYLQREDRRRSAAELAATLANTTVEKYDALLPREIRNIGYGSMYFDIHGAYSFLDELLTR